MVGLITDLDTIRTLGRKRRDENYDFRAFVKWGLNWSDRRVDALVHEIAKDVADQIDCSACANCCKEMGTGVNNAEIKRLAKRLGISVREFEERYVTPGDFSEKHIDEKPCPFLDENNRCSVYEDCPDNCKEFPYLYKEDFRGRTLMFVENVELCAIVFNTIERLKERLHFQPKRSRRSGRSR